MESFEPIDKLPINRPTTAIIYSGFLPRLGALLLDTLILLPITLPLMWFNIMQWKSPMILVVVSLIGMVYKPFFEFQYGATLGKQAVGIKVVNLELGKVSLQEVILRNVFHLSLPLISLVLTLPMYSSPEFQSSDGFMEYAQVSSKYQSLSYYNYIYFMVYIADLVVMVSDDKSRSLHDKIGKTLVVDKKSIL